MLKKWWFWLIVVGILMIILGSNSEEPLPKNNDNTIETVETKQESLPKNSPKISKEEFESLHSGMSYQEAVNIIGSEGELLAQSTIADYITEVYMWKGEGGLGANANITFQNNELVNKAQIGLK